jgi:sec-independent protein translocase protein TatB
MLILGVVALLVIPPDQLPQLARQLAKLIFDLKRSTAGIFDELRQDAAFKPEDILDKNIKAKLQELQKEVTAPIKPAEPPPKKEDKPNE